jgi:hypothetical protein
MQHESPPRPVTAAPAAIKPVRQPDRHGSSGQCLVSVLVSFTPVRRRSPASACSCSRRPRTVVNAGERRAALLESVLGATPQEFESPILRAPDLRRRAVQPRSSCLDTEICLSFCPRESSRKGGQASARRISVRLGVRGLAGSVRDRPDTRQLTDRITLSDREVPGERAPSRRSLRRATMSVTAVVDRYSGSASA